MHGSGIRSPCFPMIVWSFLFAPWKSFDTFPIVQIFLVSLGKKTQHQVLSRQKLWCCVGGRVDYSWRSPLSTRLQLLARPVARQLRRILKMILSGYEPETTTIPTNSLLERRRCLFKKSDLERTPQELEPSGIPSVFALRILMDLKDDNIVCYWL